MADNKKDFSNLFGVNFASVVAHADQMLQQYGKRDKQAEQLENMFLMEWENKPKDDGLKVTMSPDARNAVMGVIRLLTATDPQFQVGKQKGGEVSNKSEIEMMCKRIWDVSGRVAQVPIHYDAVLSAALYGEIHMPITSTKDLVQYAKEAYDKGDRKNSAGMARAEEIASQTPYLMEVWNPRYGYPEFDGLGLSAYYRKTKVFAHEIPLRFGAKASEVCGHYGKYDELDLHVFYDLDDYIVWIEDGMVVYEPHNLPSIPVSVTITEGSRLFDKPEHQRQPHLYTVYKSELWERQNLALTVLYTHLFEIGINPTFVHERGPNDDSSEPIHDAERGRITIPHGSKYYAMANKGVIDPSFEVALQIAEKKFGESTIYRQALGEPLGGSPAYSTVALLSQSGRLPLVAIQKRTSWLIADAMEKALKWWKDAGDSVEGIDVKKSDIEDDLRVDVKLDVSLPQDKLQQAQIAISLVQSEMVSQEWALEEIMNINQPDKMREAVWNEQAAKVMYGNFIQAQIDAEEQRKMQLEQMKKQQAEQEMMQQQAQQQQMMAQQQQGGAIPPQGIPPEQAQQMMQRQGEGIPPPMQPVPPVPGVLPEEGQPPGQQQLPPGV